MSMSKRKEQPLWIIVTMALTALPAILNAVINKVATW